MQLQRLSSFTWGWGSWQHTCRYDAGEVAESATCKSKGNREESLRLVWTFKISETNCSNTHFNKGILTPPRSQDLFLLKECLYLINHHSNLRTYGSHSLIQTTTNVLPQNVCNSSSHGNRLEIQSQFILKEVSHIILLFLKCTQIPVSGMKLPISFS